MRCKSTPRDHAELGTLKGIDGEVVRLTHRVGMEGDGKPKGNMHPVLFRFSCRCLKGYHLKKGKEKLE